MNQTLGSWGGVLTQPWCDTTPRRRRRRTEVSGDPVRSRPSTGEHTQEGRADGTGVPSLTPGAPETGVSRQSTRVGVSKYSVSGRRSPDFYGDK